MRGLKKLEKTELNWIVPTPNHIVFDGLFRKIDSLWSVELDEEFSQYSELLSPLMESLFEIKTSWIQNSNANFLIHHDPLLNSCLLYTSPSPRDS